MDYRNIFSSPGCWEEALEIWMRKLKRSMDEDTERKITNVKPTAKHLRDRWYNLQKEEKKYGDWVINVPKYWEKYRDRVFKQGDGSLESDYTEDSGDTEDSERSAFEDIDLEDDDEPDNLPSHKSPAVYPQSTMRETSAKRKVPHDLTTATENFPKRPKAENANGRLLWNSKMKDALLAAREKHRDDFSASDALKRRGVWAKVLETWMKCLKPTDEETKRNLDATTPKPEHLRSMWSNLGQPVVAFNQGRRMEKSWHHEEYEAIKAAEEAQRSAVENAERQVSSALLNSPYPDPASPSQLDGGSDCNVYLEDDEAETCKPPPTISKPGASTHREILDQQTQIDAKQTQIDAQKMRITELEESLELMSQDRLAWINELKSIQAQFNQRVTMMEAQAGNLRKPSGETDFAGMPVGEGEPGFGPPQTRGDNFFDEETSQNQECLRPIFYLPASAHRALPKTANEYPSNGKEQQPLEKSPSPTHQGQPLPQQEPQSRPWRPQQYGPPSFASAPAAARSQPSGQQRRSQLQAPEKPPTAFLPAAVAAPFFAIAPAAPPQHQQRQQRQGQHQNQQMPQYAAGPAHPQYPYEPEGSSRPSQAPPHPETLRGGQHQMQHVYHVSQQNSGLGGGAPGV
ncbi:hypothetical protein BDK51DRAFT_29907 [Blyttiomyces helicus]|uniref:Uncharacterized protein n=1 Tax=Blyttiomyces helicus TaxID=388810 RepID=A0A4P9WG66_9FUNG|nr:hypothetical protein BDK51DRAFT_29907 [Blyttiomyces helicus]|eukprot:RKO90020.1 hypothetical protein BDK51DRAFT_29907 [Blyttiomyces helicus]